MVRSRLALAYAVTVSLVIVGRPDGTGRGQVLDVGLVGTEPVGGVWASDHFGVLAVPRGGPKHEDRGSGPAIGISLD